MLGTAQINSRKLQKWENEQSYHGYRSRTFIYKNILQCTRAIKFHLVLLRKFFNFRPNEVIFSCPTMKRRACPYGSTAELSMRSILFCTSTQVMLPHTYSTSIKLLYFTYPLTSLTLLIHLGRSMKDSLLSVAKA